MLLASLVAVLPKVSCIWISLFLINPDRNVVKGKPPRCVSQAQRGDRSDEDRPVLQHFNTPALPFEVLEMILVQAWLSLPTSEPVTRWAFFREMSLVNRQWRDTVLQVARRHVMIRWLSEDDLSAYGAIGQRSLQPRFPGHGVEAAVITEGLATNAQPCNATSSATPTQEANAAPSSTTDSVATLHLMASIFQHSNIYLYVPQETLEPMCQSLSDAKALERSLRDREYLTRLREAVPDCRRLSIGTYTEFERATGPCAILRYAAEFPSLTHLDFASPMPFLPDLQDPSDLPVLPKIRYLRFAQYPRCYCPMAMNMDMGHGPALAVRCPAARLTAAFPGVEHLHIDTPHILKYITPLDALHTLTLEVPWSGAGQQCSIMAYNLPAALNRGLLSAPPRAGIRRTVVLHSPGAEPVGWGIARAACEQRGIGLVRRAGFE